LTGPFLGLLAVLGTLLAPATALAHPLGNFTVNQYSRIEPAADGVRIVYVLDLAEIPTFQEKARIDADRDGKVTDAERERYAEAQVEAIRRNLHLTLDGTPVDLHPLGQSATLPPGQGGPAPLRLEGTFLASIPAGDARPIRLAYRDDNFPGRLGWREIVARPGAAGT